MLTGHCSSQGSSKASKSRYIVVIRVRVQHGLLDSLSSSKIFKSIPGWIHDRFGRNLKLPGKILAHKNLDLLPQALIRWRKLRISAMEDFCRKSVKGDPEPKLARRHHLGEKKNAWIGNRIDPENRVGDSPPTKFSRIWIPGGSWVERQGEFLQSWKQ